jgi:diguanylate cyclase
LLPGLTEADALKTAEKIRLLTAERLQCGGQQITISIGVAELRPDEAWPGWLNRADNALYAAKAAGRNRVMRAA